MRKYLFIFVILSLVFCSGKNVSNDKINLSGVISLNKDKTADVPSPVEGKVVSISVDLGDKVKKGQTLLLLYSREFSQAKADFFRSMTNLSLSHKEFERARLLFEKKDIEEEEFLRRKDECSQAINRYDDSKSNLLSLGLTDSQIELLIEKHDSFKKEPDLSKLDSPYLSIVSPISGTVIFRDAIIGEQVESGKILFTVSDLSRLWALFDVDEKDLTFIEKGNEVRIKSALYPEKEFVGKVTYISNEIDEKLRATQIRVQVKNKDQLLKVNMLVSGIIENNNF